VGNINSVLPTGSNGNILMYNGTEWLPIVPIFKDVNSGISISARTESNYGITGNNAIDLSISSNANKTTLQDGSTTLNGAVGDMSFASGYNAIAYGKNSISEGNNTFAYGENSNASGVGGAYKRTYNPFSSIVGRSSIRGG